jgi:hypothetical protein
MSRIPIASLHRLERGKHREQIRTGESKHSFTNFPRAWSSARSCFTVSTIL